jgi:4-amino-4-deoxy-L-arabinose transferase-like glycosyltransferase
MSGSDRKSAMSERWRAVRDAFGNARFELCWMAYGLALLVLSTFNEQHGLVLSTQLPWLGLDLGLVYLAAGAFLLVTRAPVPEAPPPGADWWTRGAAALLAFGVGAEGLSQATGAFAGLSAGGVFLPDLAILAGGAAFALRGSRRVLPSGRLWQAALGALLLGTLATLVYNALARAPYYALHEAYLTAGGPAALVAALGQALNPLAPAVAAEQGALDLLRLAREAGLGLSPPPEILVWLANLSLLALAGMVWAAARRAPATSTGEPLWTPALTVLGAGALLYLPTLGDFGFYDPWEGHYAEVARQMIARDDWVSQYWQDNWFWSKPVGVFWMMAASFKVFGFSDFAARLPFALTGIAGIYFVYYFCRKLWSARAGVIAAVALACFPQYLFISRQAMTDIPMAVLLVIGLGCLVLALFARDEDEIERRPLTLLFLAIFAATTLPQYGLLAGELERYGLVHALAYLLPWVGLFLTLQRARKARQIYAYGFYLAAALGCLAKGLLAPGLPVIVLLLFLICTGEWGDLFSPRRLFLGLVTAALAFGVAAAVLKGAYKVPGSNILLSALVGSVALALLTMAATARGGVWDRLEVARGLFLFFLATLPWYVAMAARHGGAQLDANSPAGFRLTGFLHEFFVQHHFDRLGGGVHGDTGTTFEYFVRWGAYALWPLVALVPGALMRFGSLRSELGLERPGRAALFVSLWFAAFFTLFTLSATKFHHYILPALPALAVMIGVWLDRAGHDEEEITRPALAAGIGVLIFVGLDLIRVPQTFFNSFTYVFSQRSYPWPTAYMPEPILRLFLLTGVALLAVGMLPRPRGEGVRRTLATFWVLFFLALLGTAVLWGASPVAPKLMSLDPQRVQDWREALASSIPMPTVDIFNDYRAFYPHDRFWGYAGKLTGRLGDYGFGILALFAAAVAVASVYFLGRRRAAVGMFLGLSYAFALWSAHGYMVELGPHSGQRHMFEVYYQRRAGPEERICAYMMNWRSEHWYTENDVTVALSDPKLLEHARLPGRQWVIFEKTRLNDVRGLLSRNKICRKVVEWDLWSNRYLLATLEEDPSDPQVQACLAGR